eukprot:NODE_768_length_4042_cov_0.536647.p2 type:complete len:476 gc:universal NODE_768_length_4042_cov_0.536647:685-2112(+)
MLRGKAISAGRPNINLKWVTGALMVVSGLTFMKFNGASNEVVVDPIENYKPVFKKHGVWHLFNYQRDLLDIRKPLESQLFEFPDSEKFDSVDLDLVKRLLVKYESKSEMIQIKAGKGSGIVICGHDGVIMELLALTTYVRKYSDIPIEIYHAEDLSKKNQGFFKLLKNIKFINLKKNHLYSSKDLGKDPRKYYIKPLAMLSTHFEHVIYLDSDAFPLLHLDNLVLEKTFKYLNVVDMLLFRDYWMMHDTNPVYDLFGRGYFAQRQADSGIVVFKKSKTINVLLLSYFISAEGYFDKLFFGDKDTFAFANAYLQHNNKEHSKLYMNMEMVGYLGDSIHDMGMLHVIDGDPFFAHMNGIKFMLEHWKEYGIDVLQRSFENLSGLMIKSNMDNLDDDYSQQFMAYRHRQLDLLNHGWIPVDGKVLFSFYSKAHNVIADDGKTFYFWLKWGSYCVAVSVGSIAFVLYFLNKGIRHRKIN